MKSNRKIKHLWKPCKYELHWVLWSTGQDRIQTSSRQTCRHQGGNLGKQHLSKKKKNPKHVYGSEHQNEQCNFGRNKNRQVSGEGGAAKALKPRLLGCRYGREMKWGYKSHQGPVFSRLKEACWEFGFHPKKCLKISDVLREKSDPKQGHGIYTMDKSSDNVKNIYGWQYGGSCCGPQEKQRWFTWRQRWRWEERQIKENSTKMSRPNLTVPFAGQ